MAAARITQGASEMYTLATIGWGRGPGEGAFFFKLRHFDCSALARGGTNSDECPSLESGC
jgi:hypothetical protein